MQTKHCDAHANIKMINFGVTELTLSCLPFVSCGNKRLHYRLCFPAIYFGLLNNLLNYQIQRVYVESEKQFPSGKSVDIFTKWRFVGCTKFPSYFLQQHNMVFQLSQVWERRIVLLYKNTVSFRKESNQFGKLKENDS